MAHVFISYKRENKVFALEVKGQLQGFGFDVWLDENIRPGRKWRDEIHEKLQEAYAVVLIVTPQAMLSEYVTYEWIFALGAGVEVIPLYIESVEKFPYRLEDFQRVDFRNVYRWGELVNRLSEVQKEHERTKLETNQYIALPKDTTENLINIASLLESIETPNNEAERIASIHDFVKYGKSAIPVLLSALESSKYWVRQSAAETLGFIGDSSVSKELSDRLASEEDEIVCRAIRKALQRIGTPAQDEIEHRQNLQNNDYALPSDNMDDMTF